MCSEYSLSASRKQIEEALGQPIETSAGIMWDQTVRLSTEAPVVELIKGKPVVRERVFPLSPFPNSRLSGFENQSDGNDDKSNDDDKQIARIYDKPRWKTPFAVSPCLVPMTSFTEFAYWGERAGSALSFRIPKTEVFFAAGIGIKPFKPKGESPDGFSILTHTATEQMLEYHQRLIVILKPKHALGYLEEITPEERFEYLIENRYTGKLTVNKIRNMAKGWEKRTPVQKAKLHRETSYRNALKKERVEG